MNKIYEKFKDNWYILLPSLLFIFIIAVPFFNPLNIVPGYSGNMNLLSFTLDAVFSSGSELSEIIVPTYYLSIIIISALMCVTILTTISFAIAALFAAERKNSVYSAVNIISVIGRFTFIAAFFINFFSEKVIAESYRNETTGIPTGVFAGVLAGFVLFDKIISGCGKNYAKETLEKEKSASISYFAFFKDLRSLITVSLLTAFVIALKPFSIPLAADNSLFIEFGFVFNSVIGFLFGPFAGIMSGIIADLLGWLISQKGAFFPGYTLSAMLGGALYGLFLFRRDVNSKNFIVYLTAAKTSINLFINIGLGTLWASMLVGKGFMVLLPARVVKNAILLPIEIIVMFIVLKSINAIVKRTNITLIGQKGKRGDIN